MKNLKILILIVTISLFSCKKSKDDPQPTLSPVDTTANHSSRPDSNWVYGVSDLNTQIELSASKEACSDTCISSIIDSTGTITYKELYSIFKDGNSNYKELSDNSIDNQLIYLNGVVDTIYTGLDLKQNIRVLGYQDPVIGGRFINRHFVLNETKLLATVNNFTFNNPTDTEYIYWVNGTVTFTDSTTNINYTYQVKWLFIGYKIAKPYLPNF